MSGGSAVDAPPRDTERDELSMRLYLTPPERFWAKVDVSGDCWLWQGNLIHNGYGRFWYEGRDVLAHRWAYEYVTGETIPADKELDHLCRTRACVRPSHVEAVSHRDNMLRGDTNVSAIAARRTHCPRGHPYDLENTMFNEKGWRWCRTCSLTRWQRKVS